MTTSGDGPLVAVVMAGGAGTRFWPLSRRARPKQLLPLTGGRSLLRLAVDRVMPLVSPDRVLVVTGAEVAAAVRAELPEVPAGNVLVEPCGRDTAACVGWAAWRIAAASPDAVVLVLPADQVIPDGAALRRALAAAAATARGRGGLVTLALRPTRAETGFGYQELGEVVGREEGLEVRRVLRFVEKPTRERAEAMLAAGTFRWNSGMFAWTVGAIRSEVRRLLPALAGGLDRLCAMSDDSDDFLGAWRSLPAISVDFGVMERAADVSSVLVDFAWSDVGSWPGLEEVLPAVAGGVRLGDVVTLDSSSNVLVSDGPLVAAVGVRDLVVVATRDAVLVVPRDQAQRVKELVELLRAAGRDDLL